MSDVTRGGVMDKARREKMRREATTCAPLEPFGPWGTRLDLLDVLDAMEAERDAARRHIDEAGDGLNLLAVLDLYHERAVSAETSLDELEVQLENVSDERDRLIVWRDELAEKLRNAEKLALVCKTHRERAERAETVRDDLQRRLDASAEERDRLTSKWAEEKQRAERAEADLLEARRLAELMRDGVQGLESWPYERKQKEPLPWETDDE